MKSKLNVYQRSGENCSMEIEGSDFSTYFVTNGSTGATVTAKKSIDLEIETLGDNNHTTIHISDSVYSDGECRGAFCNVTIVNSNYSKPACHGYNCTAFGRGLDSGPLASKIKCTGELCHASCYDSPNCTASCVGAGCKATCYNNTVCAATCDGPDCEVSCRSKPGGSCTTLTLPKISQCQNCLHAPKIWDWEVCRANVTYCKNCYTAHWDLLGLDLYRLGCLDNQTEEDVCFANRFIQACYLYTCKDDWCSRTLMNNLISPPESRSSAFSFYQGAESRGLCFQFVLFHFVALIISHCVS